MQTERKRHECMHKMFAFVLIVQCSSVYILCVWLPHPFNGNGNGNGNTNTNKNDIRKIVHILWNRNEMYVNFITFHKPSFSQSHSQRIWMLICTISRSSTSNWWHTEEEERRNECLQFIKQIQHPRTVRHFICFFYFDFSLTLSVSLSRFSLSFSSFISIFISIGIPSVRDRQLQHNCNNKCVW